jgi:hypothetical protein
MSEYKYICRKDKCIYRRQVDEKKAFCAKIVCPFDACVRMKKTTNLPENPTVAEIIQNAREKGLIG